MEIKLHDAELRVMAVLWKEGEASAAKISDVLKERFSYTKTTTYTLIKRCIDKGAIERRDPGFVCRPLVSQEQTQELETTALINKLYEGAADRLVASVLGSKKLSLEEMERLKKVIREWSDDN